MSEITKEEVLAYHKQGKIGIDLTKPCNSQHELSLAYTPGVAIPCLEIARDENLSFEYTNRSNLVAVISDGSAVLGLGNIGPVASKPVMEGKGLLFKIFADIDVFDIEIGTENIEEFIQTVKNIAPTFGGINLEDIKAPEAFEIERRLKEELDIPLMHDDQHGTAIISAAALINALELSKKKIEKAKIVINGAGAAAISCTRLYQACGAKRENIVMLDSKGVIRSDRENLSSEKAEYATSRNIYTLEEAMQNADVFIGLSKADIVDENMLLSMAKNPIVFAMANPDPEISYSKAIATRKDIIMATGRSDHPNQVNNVLGFPYIFRGALDVRATKINEAMKMAAVKALAALAKENVPEQVNIAYGETRLTYGKEYIIPKPFDPRLIAEVPPAVAKAAMDSGVAKEPITDWEKYKESLLKAAQIAYDEGIAIPILLGRKETIKKLMVEIEFDAKDVLIIDPKSDEEDKRKNKYAKVYWEQRKRRGVTYYSAQRLMRERNYFAAMMVNEGDADALVSGYSRNYPSVVKPLLELIGLAPGATRIATTNIMMTKRGPLFLSDTSINIDPSAKELTKIAQMTSRVIKMFGLEPVMAMISYSNFGSSNNEKASKVREAVGFLHRHYPDMIVDGELQTDFALNDEMLRERFPFSKLVGKKVNTLIFPNLDSANITYKLLKELNDSDSIGPIMMGMRKPAHILQLGASVDEIVNMTAVAVVDSQNKEKIEQEKVSVK